MAGRVRRKYARAALAFALAVLLPEKQAAAQVLYKTLPAFTSIQVPSGINGYLVPSPDNQTYDVSLAGPQQLRDALQPSVVNNALSLGLKPNVDFTADSAVNFTVKTPTGVIQSLIDSGIGSFGANGKVLSAARLNISTSTAGKTSLVDVSSADILAQNSGSGILIIKGDDLPSMSLTASGPGNIYIQGLSGKAAVTVSGSASAYIQSSKEGSQISGAVSGTSKIYYEGGRCRAQGFGSGGNICIASKIQLPD